MRFEARLWLFAFHFLQHVYRGTELGIEIAAQDVEDLDEGAIADRIINLIRDFPAHNNPFGSQDREMLRSVSLLDAESLNQFPSRQLAFPKNFDDRDPGRMRQPLKDVTFELSQHVAHTTSIFADANILNACAETLTVARVSWCQELSFGGRTRLTDCSEDAGERGKERAGQNEEGQTRGLETRGTLTSRVSYASNPMLAELMFVPFVPDGG